jgi:hypothetical protein
VVGLVVLSAGAPITAQDVQSLARVLRDSADARVRMQAAFALGGTGAKAAVRPLVVALARDKVPSVRAAAAGALGQLGSTQALDALRRAQEDQAAAVRKQASRSIRAIERQATAQERPAPSVAPYPRGAYPAAHVIPTEEQVAWARVRHVVAVGDMGNRTGFAGDRLAQVLRDEVGRHLTALQGVFHFDAHQGLADRAQTEIRRRRIPRARLDGNIVKVQPRTAGGQQAVRCEVSLVVLKDPDRTLQSVLSGAATGSADRRGDLADQRRRLAEQAVAGAVQSAMSGVPSALRSTAR